ncbi:hypothetical protein [Paraburkholderia aromaticivorans]|uniref:hypothetical protein n=1 Tax=Paraburkholderia aromaticivorans TaxID=2026199 RepID=UPI0012FD2054|nr:hypothetical protein [Paraburkholderia aromaticivorans]
MQIEAHINTKPIGWMREAESILIRYASNCTGITTPVFKEFKQILKLVEIAPFTSLASFPILTSICAI